MKHSTSTNCKEIKAICFFVLSAMFVFLLLNSSCKKETLVKDLNTAPQVNAGDDFRITMPADSFVLAGTAKDAESNIIGIQWKKIAGPSSFNIVRPDSLVTVVRNIEAGIYEFELTATDKGGLTGKDTVLAIVHPASSNEVIFKDLEWACPMGCTVSIKNFNLLVPGTTFKVFMKNYNSSSWEEVVLLSASTVNNTYVYQLHGNTLLVYTETDATGKVDIKITY